MQDDKLKLKGQKQGGIPIIDWFVDRMKLREILLSVLSNPAYVEAILLLMKNILIDRNALYAIKEWTGQFDPELVGGGKIGDDRLGRALDRLFEADRATLQTQIVLSIIEKFQIKMDRVHNDTTSISVSGKYQDQKPEAVRLKKGHSKDHRPDLNQLVYSLCVSSDGAVPVHFKSYDGNRTDDTIHWETWLSLKSLLRTPDFFYVADSKLCVEETMRQIDTDHGRFVTIVPRTRAEVGEFTDELLSGDIRWERILRKRSQRKKGEFDTFDHATGHHQLREGFTVHWIRSSQKKKRDADDRRDRIHRASERLENLDLTRGRGPKTEAAINKRVEVILKRYKAQQWLIVDVKIDVEEKFKALQRGKPTSETKYRRLFKKVPRLHIRRNVEGIARSKAMDGIFPLTTNTKESAVDILKIYKYQPQIEKRHALLKSTLDAAPIWLKKNTRIEALMFVEYLTQMVAALIERNLRMAMVKHKVKLLESLPEGRGSKTPTIEQILRLFEHRSYHDLYDGKTRLKTFTDPLTPIQAQIISLLGIPPEQYLRNV